MSTTTGLMTFEEFERLPDHDESYKLELLDGELIRMPPPFTPHMRIVRQIFKMLDSALEMLHEKAQATDLGEVLVENGYQFGQDWLQPDVSITHAGQLEQDEKYMEGSPALAVEVISKSNTAEEMHSKVMRYLENGAREVWLVYPRTRSVSVYRGKVALEVEGTLTSELLPGVSIDLSQVFGQPK